MRTLGVSTAEHSEPVIRELIQARGAKTVQAGLTISELAGELTVPILANRPEGTVASVIIAGGAASGKSTLAAALHGSFAEQGVRSATISSDDFVLGDRAGRHEQEAAGLGPEDKYDFNRMRQAIGAICANRATSEAVVEVPQYDSHSGLAIDGARRQRIQRVGALIVEGDMLGRFRQQPQELYPEQAGEPLTVYMHVPDEHRLRRRVGRDLEERNGHGGTASAVVANFELRQDRQHIPYTLTYAETADVIVTPAADYAEYGDADLTYDLHTLRRP